MSSNLEEPKRIRFDHLDGIRGLMAMWVFIGHLFHACTGNNLPIGPHGLAVDVFMILSGFLMAYHWEIRNKNGFGAREVGRFYLKRFFRIAPLFYVVLLIAILSHVYVSELRIGSVLALQSESEYAKLITTKVNSSSLSFRDVLAHLTFTFGLIPEYVSSNNIPDWSISLEMQFYLAFPLFMLLMRRVGSVSTVIILIVIGMFAIRLVDIYASTGKSLFFTQPSMLLFKVNVFLVAMLIAMAFTRFKGGHYISYLILAALCLIDGVAWQVALSIVFIIAPMFLNFENKDLGLSILSSKPLKFLGEISYGVYLIHNLVFYPVLGYLVKYQGFMNLSSTNRFLLAAMICIPIVFLIATILYYKVEKTGIEIGKKIDAKYLAS